MDVIVKVFFSCLATFGFAVYFGVRKKELLLASVFCAMLGSIVYEMMQGFFDGVAYPVIIASITVGAASQFFSRRLRVPSTLMILSGIIPFVPGRNLYAMMQFFVQSDFIQAIGEAAQTLFISGSIALGIMASSLFSISLRRARTPLPKRRRKV